MPQQNRTSLKLPDDLKLKLKEEADRQHRTLHNLILSVLYDYAETLKENQDKPSD